MFEDHKKLHFRTKNPKLLTQGIPTAQDTVSKWYLTYKIIFGAYFLIGYGIFDFYLHGHVKDNLGLTMIYLTHWCHKLMTTSFMYNSILVVIRYTQEKRKQVTNNCFFERNCLVTKLTWIMSSSANNLAIAVTIVYWGALYDSNEKRTLLEEFDNYNVHLIQTVITLIDVAISARPWRFCHAIYPFLFALTYLGFNVIYTVVLGGKNSKGEDFVYSILDWGNTPTTAILWVVVFTILIIVSQMILCILSFTKEKVFEHWRKKFRDDIQMENVT